MTLGPVGPADGAARFRLYCVSPSRETHGECCSEEERTVRIAVPAGPEFGPDHAGLARKVTARGKVNDEDR